MRKLLLLVTIILSTLSTYAQDQKFHFGLKITPSMAWIKPDNKDIEREGYKLGFSYGVQTEFRIQENYAIASGVQVAYRGGKLKLVYDDSLNIPDAVVNYKLQYVEIPMALKMKTNEFNKIRYYGMFGLSPGFIIRAKYDTDDEDDIDAKKDINVFNVNMLIGAGLEYTISGSTALTGGIEFNNGFFDVFDGKDAKGVTNYLGLNIGVLF
ncbi:MAG: PorT family protein [Bacteroidia bacterium]|nr:PorT family protein [Bacteroidia bacterium]